MSRMIKELDFEDKTVLATPNPVHSSSMTSQSGKVVSFMDLKDIPERDFNSKSDSSLGILSNKDDEEIFPNVRLSAEASLLRKQRELARSTLKQTVRFQSDLTSLPSRYLRPSNSTASSSIQFFNSESTINESDLLPDNSSTPRGSLACVEYPMRDRQSSAGSISSLANMVRDVNINIDTIADVAQKTLRAEGSFRCGEAAIAKLAADEISWKNKNYIPTEIAEFSVNSQSRFSMGSFFQQRSEDPSKIFAKSPQKSAPPVPLVDVSTASENSEGNLSDIQHILSEQNTNEALDLLYTMKPTKSNNKKKKSISFNLVDTKPADNFAKGGGEQVSKCSKENISPHSDHEKSTISSRSSSSLSSLPNGRLPLATTKSEIIWGCVKPGKSISQEFILRNRSSSRLGVHCSVSNPSFRLNKEGTELNFSSMMKLILHPYESRSVSVTFAPTTIGAAVDNLNFSSTDTNHKQTTKQFVRLYAYGGHGNVTIHKLIKDTTGKFLLSLGNINHEQELKQVFVIKNTGSLAAFAHFDLIVNSLYSFSNVTIYPQTAVLLPGEEREVSVTYNVQKKDFSYIKSKVNNYVIDVGKVQMIHGTEVDRARLRKICQKAQEKGQNVNGFVLQLIEKFPGEVIPTDLKHFRESFHSIEELLRRISNEEIVVTLEQDVDHTLTAAEFPDETVVFHSLCENTNVGTLESTILRETCLIEPTRIILTPPDKVKDRIFVTNNNQKILYFEVSSTPEGLHLKPKVGTIRPGDTLIIETQYTKKCNDKTVFKVRILVDNESFEVDVKVVFVNKT